MKKIATLIASILFISLSITSCSTGPSACECVEQFNYYGQDGGMLKLDRAKFDKCVEKFKDKTANQFPEDVNSARRNARKKCN